MQVRPRRSVLFLPAANQRALEKARGLDVDGLIFDLEDAVAPTAKPAGRAAVAAAVQAGGYGSRELVLRINPLDSDWGAADIACAASLPIAAVLLPKVESAAMVRETARALEQAGAPPQLDLWVMAETPRGILALQEIAAASERLRVIVAGTSDLSKELRVPPDPERLGLLPALSHCVLAARAQRLDVLDGVHLDLADKHGFEAACAQGRRLGFDGKTLIHPSQIAVANRSFSPNAAALRKARKVVAAWEAAAQRGEGMVVVDGRLVENLHVEEARRLLALDAAIAGRD